MVKLIKCNCTHAYQDKHYGEGIRVGNSTSKKDVAGKAYEFRCTVCSKVTTSAVK